MSSCQPRRRPLSSGKSLYSESLERVRIHPFGVPTANEIGVYGRRYWTDWLPRLE